MQLGAHCRHGEPCRWAAPDLSQNYLPVGSDANCRADTLHRCLANFTSASAHFLDISW
jgi:hypothetical protein